MKNDLPIDLPGKGIPIVRLCEIGKHLKFLYAFKMREHSESMFHKKGVQRVDALLFEGIMQNIFVIL